MKKKWINVFLLSLLTLCCTAQTDGYKFYSQLDSIKTSGFYNIELTPVLNAHVNKDYSDLRVINDSGKWIPHLLHSPASERSDMTLIMDSKFSIKENSKVSTSLIIENRQNITSNIGLIITNTAAERFCTLSGSNDKKDWFVINDSILLNPIPSENATENIFRINFPPNNYRFYKIVIHNNNKDPFDIKGVVKYTLTSGITNPLNKLIENPITLVQQKDSGKISYIKITQQQAFHFDYLHLKISGVKYFYRKVDLFIPVSKGHSYSNPGQYLQTFAISNNSTLQFNVPLTKASVFYLFINNDDNLPLLVNEVNTACNNHYITTYLEKGVHYKLIMGNTDALLPNYDLTKLNTKIPDSIPFLTAGKIISAEEKNMAATPAKNNKWMIWAAIITALLILLFFIYKMLKDVEKRKIA